MQSDEPHIDLDLTGTYCPMAFVKLRIFADQLATGQTFTAVYEETKANEPLLRSITGLGHIILTQKKITPNDTTIHAYVNKHHISEKKLTLVIIKVQVKK